MNIKTQRLLSCGLSLLNVAGVIGTFIFVAKETPQYQQQKGSLPDNSTKKQKVKTFVKSYKKSLIFAGATIATGIGSRIISAKTEASLIATATMLDTSFRKYKNKVKDILGLEKHKEVVKEVAKEEFGKPEGKAQDGEKLYLEEHIGYFYARPEDVKNAYLKLLEDLEGNLLTQYNGGYGYNGVFTIGEFLTYCKGRPLSKNLSQERLNFGWSWDYMTDQWNYTWVHMQEEPDENGVIFISWFEEPIWNPWDWYDHEYKIMTDEEYYQGQKDLLTNPDGRIYTIKQRRNHE